MTTCHDISAWDDGGRLQPARFRHIVVGVDGSPNSIAALRLAAALGARDGAKIEAVCAYRPYFEAEYPFSTATPSYGPAREDDRQVYASPGGVVDAAADAHETLEHAARSVFGDVELPGLVLRPVEGSPHDVLTRIALAADLLVVGARGHSGPLGLLLGSTAQACARHAPCPVLVVPAHETHAPDAEGARATHPDPVPH